MYPKMLVKHEQTRAFRNQLAKECDTWTNARSIVRTNFVRQKFRERLCRSSNLFFKSFHTLNTLLGWSRVYDSFHVQLANFWKHQQPTSLCTVLTLVFESSSKETSFWLALVIETGISRYSCLFHFSKLQQRRSMPSATASHLKAALFMFNETKESKN